MALRHLLLRITPGLGRGWIAVAAIVVGVAVIGVYVQWSDPAPPIALLALGPDLSAFPMRIDPQAARPGTGELARVGTRRSRCGEPTSPMDLLSTVWETESGGRMVTLEYGGRVRKWLYDLDGDGVIERESWTHDGDAFNATRRTRLPIPEYLLPLAPDTALADGLLADGLRAVRDPDTGAPAPVPDTAGTGQGRDTAGTDSAPGPLIEPEIRPVQPLGERVSDTAPDTVPADTGGGLQERLLPHFWTGNRPDTGRDDEP